MTPTTPLSDAELLARLVAFDTVSRNSNLPLADFLTEYLADRHRGASESTFRVRSLPSPDGTKANLVIWLGPDTSADEPGGLVLSSHMDVVPADDLENWESPPFELTDREDRWVARGAADMKGFLALATNLAAAAAPDRLRHPLVLVLTYDEELGSLGAGHLAETWSAVWDGPPLPRAAIVGEPTRLRVVRMHKGHVKARITYRGTSAHSGYPHLGTNAVERAADGVVALGALRRDLESERPPSAEHFPEVPFAALNVATIAGGTAINMVPDRCTVEVGVRLLPGMSAEAMTDRVREAVVSTAAPEGYDFEVLAANPPLALPPDAPVHRFLCNLVGQEEGETVSYASDAGWLHEMGLDCAVFGPGSIEVAHKPNEFLPKADLARARELFERIVDHFCSGGTE